MNYILILFSLLLLICCKQVEKTQNKVNAEPFVEAYQIDEELNKYYVFEGMDLIYELDNTCNDTSRARSTSNVAILTTHDFEDNLFVDKDIECTARLLNHDTLFINISGAGAQGITLKVINGQYSAQPYLVTCVVLHDENYKEVKSTTKTESKTLILNKDTYELGDSLFGYVYYRDFNDNADIPIKNYTQVYFRTKVINW